MPATLLMLQYLAISVIENQLFYLENCRYIEQNFCNPGHNILEL